MSLTQASDTENMKIPSDNQSKNGDEQIEGMSVSDVPEFSNPLKDGTVIQYSREELVSLKQSPLSQKKPDFLIISDVPQSILNPDRWNFERKKSDTPTENGPRAGDIQDHRKRTGDPRERLRKENDGIVLSPQRRSFNSGCYVPVTRTNRPHSPLGGKNEPSHIGGREIQTGTRRIGSGRILRDTWDYNEKPESADNDYGFRGQQRGNDREDKYERRSYGRDIVICRDRENNSKDGRRGHERHREPEEPEWFSGGPMSQNDTIELRGFEEHEKAGAKKKLSPARVKRSKEWSKKKIEAQGGAGEEKEERKGPAGRSTPTVQVAAGVEKPQQQKLGELTQGSDNEKVVGSVVNDQSFLDDILKFDSISLLTNGVGGDGDNMKSRFSHLFKRESPEKVESRRSSMQEDHHMFKDLFNDFEDTKLPIPGSSESYFAPISPAGNSGGIIGAPRGAQPKSQPINIMEMLQRGKHQAEEPAPKPQLSGKILSLDELEAKMRQNVEVSSGMPQKHQQQKPDEEMTAAFKKLLAQAQAGGHAATSNGPMNKTQPMSLLEMLNHSQQQDEAARMSGNAHLFNATSPNITSLHPHASDLTLKLQQAQLQQQKMDMLNKLINATGHPPHVRTSPLHDMGMQQSRELLNRPEAQAILQGLKRGEITTQHLYQQLANPALQPRHREMLLAILKIQGGGAGYGPSPRVLSPVPPHHMFQQQQQQLRVSPLPPTAMHQRIPSPRELQVHTQHILQRALIKKKLEEQQENYRKKQEMQRGQSPSTNSAQGTAKSVSSPTPLAFTPTSVLRKMTADKDEAGKENKTASEGKVPPGRALTGMRPQPPQPQGQQWNAPFAPIKQPAGRPIVKANNNYQTQTPEQFFSQHQQQQRMFNQPPPGTPQQSQQQRKPSGAQFGGAQPPNGPGGSQAQYNPQYPTNHQFTQQQLRAQHQHRPANQPMQQQPHHQPQQLAGFPQHHISQQQIGAAWHQFFNSAQANRSSNPMGRGGLNDGDLSPTTTNQLARWFSPDLLERARGGELPSTAGLAQHAVSLEEIERQTAPPVHN